VAIATGDVSNRNEVLRAADGCESCIHSAAIATGGAPRPMSDFVAVNFDGTRHVLDAVQTLGLRRAVLLSSSNAFDRSSTLTEMSAVRPDRGEGDPYGATKIMAYEETQRRVREGVDAVTVLPGATFGPGPNAERAVAPPGFNARLLLALRGEIDEFPVAALSFVLAADVARAAVSALERGVPGEKYLAFGQPDDVSSGVDLFNLALEAVGSAHLVRPLRAEDIGRPDVVARWGPALLRSTQTRVKPPFENALTLERLGHEATPLQAAVRITVEWLAEHKLI
jgi:nucleoside-diphosphate-sugar epimerase